MANQAETLKDGKNTTEVPVPGSRGGKRRQRILNAFHDCIIRQGYGKTTLRDVAGEAGMTASHLLYYFSGKDAILDFEWCELGAHRTCGRAGLVEHTH